MRDHVLVTGVTGLLGRYILKDLLLAGIPVACLVRGTRRQSAHERMARVMAFWETRLKRKLPAPHVVEGDICAELAGVDDVHWVAGRCRSVINSAASLSFVSEGPEGEPWRSNVGGTSNVLELCRAADITDFHHVSTAYVCGLRRGVIRENETDEGQAFGNDYERSKVEAEKLVRAADFLTNPTIYRPSIIVGDSQTGFTCSFHGFYAMLRLAVTLAGAFTPEQFRQYQSGELKVRITLDGTESKNLVAVDWVSDVICHIFNRPEHHGKTYHVTSPNHVSAGLLQSVMHEMMGVATTEFCGSKVTLENATEVESLFYDHLRVYESYWRDDPTFDATNTHNAAPDLTCPNLDHDLLVQLSQAAVETGFRWKDPAPMKTASA